jgi:hypothetical protein
MTAALLLCAFIGWITGMGDLPMTDPVLGIGYEAVRQNPGNLAAGIGPKASIRYVGFGLDARSSGLAFGDYRRYFSRKVFLSAADKQAVLQAIGDRRQRLQVDVAARLVHAQYRQWGMAIDYEHAFVSFLPRDGFDLVLNGNQLNRRYDLAGFGSETLSFWRFTLARAAWLGSGGLGISVSGLVGTRYCRLDASDGELLTTPRAMFGRFHALQTWASGGYGVGVSLGGTLYIGRNWQVGAAVRDLYSGIRWNRNPGVREIDTELESLDVERYIERPAVDSFLRTTVLFHPGPAFRTRLPGVLAAGIGFRSGETFRAAVLLNLPVAESRFHSAPPLAGLQTELRLLRTVGTGLFAGWHLTEGWVGRLGLAAQLNGLVAGLGAGIRGRSLNLARRADVGLNLSYEF